MPQLELELAKPANEMRSSLFASVESHLIGYAAEESRRTGNSIGLEEFRFTLTAVLEFLCVMQVSSSTPGMALATRSTWWRTSLLIYFFQKSERETSII